MTTPNDFKGAYTNSSWSCFDFEYLLEDVGVLFFLLIKLIRQKYSVRP